ncbi:MAG: hypothetical protein G3M78_00525 [Candidatus Nitrohelix vancouverensis]|uniref:Thiamine-binding protein domain-containing protein n=1 Tax=Candidatus Nitrohelix vancouverensis TaxID=2705534 RepID=A0A7T0BZW9_9BACT|nr:MAG: hypothetical protein G3M78_00525 [Candidatus Nitrohelix vancouverensis]
MPTFNVLIATQFNDIADAARSEITDRLGEHGFEAIPTIDGMWEMACDAEDETDAKDTAIEKFVNVCRTYPFELRLVVQCGSSQIVRRRKQFEP